MSIELSTVKYVTTRANKKIEELHLVLEANGLDFDMTNFIRGQIREARSSIEDVLETYESRGSRNNDLDL